MPNIGPVELIIILVIALLILGPGQAAGRRIGAREEHPRVPQGRDRRAGLGEAGRRAGRTRGARTRRTRSRRAGAGAQHAGRTCRAEHARHRAGPRGRPRPRLRRRRSPPSRSPPAPIRRPDRAPALSRHGRRRHRPRRRGPPRAGPAARRRAARRRTPVPTPSPDGAVMPLVDHLGRAAQADRDRAARHRGRLDRGVRPRAADHRGPEGAATATRRSCCSPPARAFFITLKVAIAIGIVLGMPVILFELWRFVVAGPHVGGAPARPAVGAPRARLLRRRGDRRLRRPALRDRLPLELRDRRAAERLDGRRLLRLRGHDVRRVRARHGVPDRPRPALEGRDRDERTAAGEHGATPSSPAPSWPRSRRPAATSSARSCSG